MKKISKIIFLEDHKTSTINYHKKKILMISMIFSK